MAEKMKKKEEAKKNNSVPLAMGGILPAPQQQMKSSMISNSTNASQSMNQSSVQDGADLCPQHKR